MKKETVKKFFEFLEKKEKKEGIEAKLRFSPESLPERLDSAPKGIEKGIEIEGDLDLSYSHIKSLPKGLKVRGALYLSYSLIESLPEGLEVGGSLFLTGSAINSLSDLLQVGGSLWMGDTPLSRTYSIEQIEEMIESGWGYVKGKIYT